MQRDPLVQTERRIPAVVDGQSQVGTGGVAINLVGAHLQPQREAVAALMIKRAGEGEHHPAAHIAALLLGQQLGAQHLYPLTTAIEVVAQQGAIIGKFEDKRMAIAGQTRAIEGRQGVALMAEHQRVGQQGIGGVANHEAVS